jgi:hypothetical protein
MRKIFTLSALLLLSACGESPRKARPVEKKPTTDEQRADLRGTENYQFLTAVFENSDTYMAFGKSEMLVREIRQVGKDGDAQIPYPTNCKLEVKSKYQVYTLIDSEIAFLESNNYRKADFKVSNEIASYTLLDDVGNSDKCDVYVAKQNTAITLGERFLENRYFQKISDTQIDNVITNKSFSTSN